MSCKPSVWLRASLDSLPLSLVECGFQRRAFPSVRTTPQDWPPLFFLQIEHALTSGSFKKSSAKPKMSSKDGVIFLSMRRMLNSSPLENDMLDNYDPFLLGW